MNSRWELRKIIAAQDTEIESEYVIAEQVHRRERLIGHHFLMETREEVTRHSHVGLHSLFHHFKIICPYVSRSVTSLVPTEHRETLGGRS